MNISKKAIKRTGVPAVRRGASLPVSAYENDDAPLLACVLKNSLLGLAATAISGLILISATCALAYSSADPSSLIAPLSLLALLPSNFLGGFVTAKKTHRSPLACGLVCGAVTTLVMILFSLLLRGAPTSNYEFWQSALLHSLSVLFCILGAMAGNVKIKSRRNKRRFGN